MTVVWIVGWGIDPESFRQRASERSPGANLHLCRPTSSALQLAAEADLVVAWSYGAFLILDAAMQGASFRGEVRLYAPFLAFCAEDRLGGRFERSQVLWLKRWLRKDPAGALTDFAIRAGLPPHEVMREYPIDELTNGLDRMIAGIPARLRQNFSARLPAGWTSEIGEQDLLLDAPLVAHSLPGTQVIPGAGHSLSQLLPCAHAF